MRFVLCVAVLFGVSMVSRADDAALNAKIAALEAQVASLQAHTANVEARLLAAEQWGNAMGGYHPPLKPLPSLLPPSTPALRAAPVSRPVAAAAAPQRRRGIFFSLSAGKEGGGGCGCPTKN